MKTLKENQKDIDSVTKEIETLAKKKEWIKSDYTENKRLHKRLEFLRLVRIYLELNPTEQFCESERTKVQNILNAADKSWADFYDRPNNKEGLDKLPQKAFTKRKNDFLKEIDLPTLRNQIKTLNYILS